MEDIFFHFISNVAEGVVGVDREQRIVLWNNAAEALLGFRAEEVLGRPCYGVLRGRNESGRPFCRESCPTLMMTLRAEQVPSHDLLLRKKTGQAVWMSVRTMLIASRQSDLGVLIHLCSDIDRQKELERCVQQFVASVAMLVPSRGTGPPVSPHCASPSMDLTRREAEVLYLLALGTSTAAIAHKLCISPSTVRNHIHNILAKLGVHSRLEAVTLALRSRLIFEGGSEGGTLGHEK